ncbi:MAG: nuclear transport factor 2 family protein [Casimicrobiaceae bacterium]
MSATATAWPARLVPVIDFYESLTEVSLARIATVYREDARFKDPFNEVVGVAAIEAIFRHMYETTQAPRFVVAHAALSTDGCEGFLTWTFHFRLRSDRPEVERVIRGATHLRFGEDGRIAEHRDYWDAAEELYETLPVIGVLMRWLRRRVSRA